MADHPAGTGTGQCFLTLLAGGELRNFTHTGNTVPLDSVKFQNSRSTATQSMNVSKVKSLQTIVPQRSTPTLTCSFPSR